MAEVPLALSFGYGALGYGLIAVAWGAGSVLGSLLGRHVSAAREGATVAGGILGLGVALAVIAALPHLAPVLVALVAGGLADALGEVAAQGMIQLRTGDDVAARAMSVLHTAVRGRWHCRSSPPEPCSTSWAFVAPPRRRRRRGARCGADGPRARAGRHAGSGDRRGEPGLGLRRLPHGAATVPCVDRENRISAQAYPKIELHVHLEGTVRPRTLLAIARRNGHPLPADTEEGLAELYRYRDFAHFIEVWILTTNALRTARDFRKVVVDYAAEAASFGCVYLEGIFSPAERVQRGVSWDELFAGYCDGAQEARELHGVEVRLTPDIYRGCPEDLAVTLVEHAARYRDRGVVGVGLGGLEARFPPELYARPFAVARDLGLASVPHAGEVAGPASIRGALEALGAHRIRHGVRAVEDAGLLAELAGRGTVLDVCPISNLRTGVVASLADHPLPRLLDAGVRCSIATDDPAMFDTDLGREHAAARELGVTPRGAYADGLVGAVCDDATRERLRAIGDAYDWDAAAP